MVVGHEDCGFTHASSAVLLERMFRRGISEEAVETMRGPLETYLDPPINPEQTVPDVVEVLRTHPDFPRDVLIHGLLMHAGSGKTRMVADGARG